MRSMIRFHSIERQLRDLNFKIELHESILHPKPEEELTIKGTHHSFSLLCLVTVMWGISLGISLFKFFNGFSQWFYVTAIILATSLLAIIVIMRKVHNKFNAVNYQEEMKKAAGLSPIS